MVYRLGICSAISTALAEPGQTSTNEAVGNLDELHVTSRIPVAFCLGLSRLPESLFGASTLTRVVAWALTVFNMNG